MTKNEKELINLIKEVMKRKKIKECDPKEMYTVTKRSNKDFMAEFIIVNRCYTSYGKEKKEVIKNLIKEIRG